MEFKPPSPAELKNKDDWLKWKQKFELYLKATGKDKSTDEELKIAILLTVIGDVGIEIYNTFKEDQKKTYVDVMKNFDAYYIPKKNRTMETFKFNNLNQKEDQTIDAFMTELKKQAALCEFECECKKSYANRMIRDRVIIGIFDKEIQQRLLRDDELTLDRIQEYVKAIELSKEHIKVLNPTESIDYVSKNIQKIKCSYCTYEHIPRKCPAYNQTCKICNKKNHFAKACRQKPKTTEDATKIQTEEKQVTEPSSATKEAKKNESKVSEIKKEENIGAILYINEIKKNSSKWLENISVSGVDIQFKIDTGAEISVLPEAETQTQREDKGYDYNPNYIW